MNLVIRKCQYSKLSEILRARGQSFSTDAKIFKKTNILLPDTHTHLYLSRGNNISFPEKFAYLLNEWYPTIFTSNVLIGKNQINLNKMKDAIWDPT